MNTPPPIVSKSLIVLTQGLSRKALTPLQPQSGLGSTKYEMVGHRPTSGSTNKSSDPSTPKVKAGSTSAVAKGSTGPLTKVKSGFVTKKKSSGAVDVAVQVGSHDYDMAEALVGKLNLILYLFFLTVRMLQHLFIYLSSLFHSGQAPIRILPRPSRGARPTSG